MKQHVKIRRILLYVGPALLLFLINCIVETEGGIKEKLETIVKDDLATITHEIPDSSLLDSTYYSIVEYKKYTESKYSRKAVVDFYFLKGVPKKIRRKYRYHREWGKWDRYYNRWATIADQSSSEKDASPKD
ncbi:MAG: hypothetical protein GF401_16660 [Chitinivibrionales bacterium]|nr:hypothetical protein [Chitinivibrionales bacterium]